ncbi:hypothetical protein N431DRAFT_163245 [Stipitochalara longipes BDJ]|nr:hypothetical protein N431DRAFT_163245 [Stipitochalara longipes BDJ]
MLTKSQIFLLVVGCHSIKADVSGDDEGVPMLTGDLFDVGLRYEQSRFIPFSINPPEKLIHHNGSRERGQGPCYGYSCNGALCCDNGSCAGSGQICCGRGICDAGYECCEDIGCIVNGATCCRDGGSCPAGQGCFIYNDSNQIFCSPTGGGTEPATSTVPPQSTTSFLNQPTSATTAVLGSSSVYYYTYEYEWTTFYYIYEIETFTTYIVTTVWSVVAIDADVASSSFSAIKATFTPTAPPTSLPGASTPSPTPTAQTAPTGLTVAASTSSASHSSIPGSAASGSGVALSAKVGRGEIFGVMCIVGAVIMVISF